MKVLPLKILVLIVFPSLLFAQGIETSPYSAFGLGDKKYEGTDASVNMGGLNNVFWDNVHVNPFNPASYSYLSLTNFSLGAQGKSMNLETEDQTGQTSHVGVNHLVMGIPMGRWGGMAFGFVPTTSTGYDIASSETLNDPGSVITDGLGYNGDYTQNTYFRGSGAVNRFFIGGAFSPFKGFSIGVNAMYDFGNLTRKTVMNTPSVYKVLEVGKAPVLVYEGNQYSSSEDISLKLREWNYQLGIMYTGSISENFQYTLGGTYGIGNSTELEVSRYLYTFKYGSNGLMLPIDTLKSASGEATIRNIDLPHYGGFGLSVGNYKKWMIGVNFDFKDALQGSDEIYDGVEFTKQQSISVGGYITPKYNSLMSYWERITYRAGVNYEDTGLRIDGTEIVDYSVNFGLGLPMKASASNVNIGGSYGSRGTTDNGLIKENYFTFNVSFSLSDKWFRKVKYN
jgi:hypothetical protein